MSNTMNFDMADAVSRISKADSCKHCVTTALPDEPVVTMAYVPFQLDKTAYTPQQALENGTLFTALNKQFCGRSIINE